MILRNPTRPMAPTTLMTRRGILINLKLFDFKQLLKLLRIRCTLLPLMKNHVLFLRCQRVHKNTNLSISPDPSLNIKLNTTPVFNISFNSYLNP